MSKARRFCELRLRNSALGFAALAVVLGCAISAVAENCTTANDMDAATRTALTTAGQRYFDLLAKGDTTSLRQAAIPSLASDFSGVEATIKDKQSALTGAKGTARPPFLLEADGTAPIVRAEFYCGVFGRNGQTADSAAFYLNNLPPGKYGVVILDVSSSKGPHTVSWILQQVGSEWKVGGLYIKASQIGGHDSDWFLKRAQEFKTKGQAHNAWFYYLEARSLISPLPFMSTAATDKLYDESQKAQPTDLPADGKTADLPAGTATYKLTDLFPELVGNDLDLIVKYQAADVSNTNAAYSSNVAVMKALLAKYPELRDAFAAIVARAVDPSGRDYGTMLAMKDIK
ncbi:MAG TPA: hypothetical protein VGZ91_02130 [Candidatus Sulfotelmatobacter sp.]|nr:hypothetical protein [Candidatus Sulfotelmatobacter sp.]